MAASASALLRRFPFVDYMFKSQIQMKIELVRSLEWQRAARGTTSPKTQLHAFKLINWLA